MLKDTKNSSFKNNNVVSECFISGVNCTRHYIELKHNTYIQRKSLQPEVY